MKSLEAEIGQILSLIGLLLVFVIGYFTALLPRVDEEVARPAPVVQADRASHLSRLSSFRKLMIGFLVADFLVLALVGPISGRVVSSWPVSGPFPTIRAGLLLIDLFLVALLIAGTVLLVRLWKRIESLRKVR